MKNMKKILAAMMAVLMVVSMTACSTGNDLSLWQLAVESLV